MLFAFENQPAKDACQIRYLVTADMSLLKDVQTRGKESCLHLEGSMPKPAWRPSKAVPVFSLFSRWPPVLWLIHQAMTDSAVVSMPLLAIMITVCRMLWRSASIDG